MFSKILKALPGALLISGVLTVTGCPGPDEKEGKKEDLIEQNEGDDKKPATDLEGETTLLADAVVSALNAIVDEAGAEVTEENKAKVKGWFITCNKNGVLAKIDDAGATGGTALDTMFHAIVGELTKEDAQPDEEEVVDAPEGDDVVVPESDDDA